MVSDRRRTMTTTTTAAAADAVDDGFLPMNDESDDEFLDGIELTENAFEYEERPLSAFDVPESDRERRRIVTNEPPARVPIFKWKRTASFCPDVFPFDDTTAGVQKEEFEFDKSSTVLSFFEALVTPNLIGKIVFETNRYYKQTVENKLDEKSRSRKWFDTNVNEMYTFVAVALLMARRRLLKITEHWSSDPLLSSPIYSAITSKDRYLRILEMIHFCNNDIQVPGDRLFKIKMVLTEIRKNFRDAMKPFRNIAIDETLVLCKDALNFRQYVESKRHRFGMKLFVICDVQTDYVLDFIVYAGLSTKLGPYNPNIGTRGAVVKTLMKPYLNKGHTLFTEDQYTSPVLAKYLLRHKTNTIGTVRENRRGMPNLKKKLKFGEFESAHTKKILALKWMERSEVYVLSTCAKARLISVEKRDRNSKPIQKPECIIQFNNSIDSIDKSDLLLSSFDSLKSRIKWYKKMFFHLIDLSVLNAHSLYKTTTGNHAILLADFQLKLIREILQKYSTIQTLMLKQVRQSKGLPLRIKAPHYPSECPPTPSGIRGRKRCVVCTAKSKNQTSYYQCKECDNIGLCVVPCFGIYHTKINYTPK